MNTWSLWLGLGFKNPSTIIILTGHTGWSNHANAKFKELALENECSSSLALDLRLMADALRFDLESWLREVGLDERDIPHMTQKLANIIRTEIKR